MNTRIYNLHYRLAVVFFIVLFGFNRVYCTSDKDSVTNPLTIGLRSHYGFIIVHTKELSPFRESYPIGFEIDIDRHYTGQNAWDYCNCYPKVGGSLYFWDFGHPSSLGYSLVAIGYVEPFFGNPNKTSISLRAGTGFSYMTKPYHPVSNPDNYSYSTILGFPLLLAINLNHSITPKLKLNLSANYNHISNGGIKEPNKGINYPTVSLGINYSLVAYDFRKKLPVSWKEKFSCKNRYDLQFFATAKQLNHKELEKYPIFGLYGGYSHRVSRLNALNTGAEWVHDYSNKEEIKRSVDPTTDYKRGSLMLGNEFLLGRFVFSQQLGIYIYNPYHRKDDPLCQRYGLVFLISRKFNAGISLKAHRHVADFLDFRIGISL